MSASIEHLGAAIARREGTVDQAVSENSLSEEDRKLLRNTVDYFTEIAVSGVPILAGLTFVQVAFNSTQQVLYIDVVTVGSQEFGLVSGRIERISREPQPYLQRTPAEVAHASERVSAKCWDIRASVGNGRLVGGFLPSQPASLENEESFGAIVLHPLRRWHLLRGTYSRYREDHSTMGASLTIKNQERPLAWVRASASENRSLLDCLSVPGPISRRGFRAEGELL